MEVKDIIKNRRMQLSLTMKEVADRVGVSEATVSRWESGDIENMRRDKIAALAKALQISPSIIMGWDDQETKHTLPIDEHRLLGNYRKLNATGKIKAQEDVEDLTQIPKYTNRMPLLQAAHQRTDIDLPDDTDTSDDKYFDD